MCKDGRACVQSKRRRSSKLKDDTGSLVTAGIHSIKEFPDSRHRLRADMGFVKGDVLGCECFLLLDIEVNWERR